MATVKQVELAKRLIESRGKKSMHHLMVEAGYAENTALKRAKEITTSKTFIELLNHYGATDTRIARVLKAGLEAKNGKHVDHVVRHRYVETIMKAKGLLKETPGELGSLANFMESMKDFNLEILIAIKQRYTTKDTPNVTDVNGS